MLSKYLINHNKEYIATIKLGKKTDTADGEGNVIEEKSIEESSLDKKNVEKVLESFKGSRSQTPPMYSAIKVNGKKLYEYARQGKTVEIQPRKIEIYHIELISISKEEKEITYKVSCSKGTYIRTLCEDIAKKLNTVGFMKELERTKVGEFSIEQAVKIEDINNANIISIEEFFKEKKEIILDDINLRMFINGVKLHSNLGNDIYKIYSKENEFIGIGEVKDKKLKRDICVQDLFLSNLFKKQ